MRRIILALPLLCLSLVPARAEIECSTPMDDWKPVADLRAEAVKLGWTVQKIRADDGCYHVRATDKDSKPVEAVFDPQTLKLLGTSNDDHEKHPDGGKHDHD